MTWRESSEEVRRLCLKGSLMHSQSVSSEVFSPIASDAQTRRGEEREYPATSVVGGEVASETVLPKKLALLPGDPSVSSRSPADASRDYSSIASIAATPASVATTTSGVSVQNAHTVPAASSALPGVSVPVVFANPSAVASLPADQQDGVTQIASNFTAAVQASGAAPNSPEYKKIWDTAAFQADQEYEAMYGIDAFNKLEMSQSY